jgi:MSHA pilin protein MshD
LSACRSDEGLRAQSGVTLIELVVSLTVIGIALAGTFSVMTTTTRWSVDPMLRYQANAIAEAYLEEILLRSFWDPDLGPGGGSCPGPEATRDLFDNVCDYNGLDDLGARDQTGAAVAGLGRYRVRVSVDPASSLGGLSGANVVLRADVRLTHPDGIDFTLSGYRTEY